MPRLRQPRRGSAKASTKTVVQTGSRKRKTVDSKPAPVEKKSAKKRKVNSPEVAADTPYVPKSTEWPMNIKAPMSWKAKVESTAYGIYVDDDHCIFGDDSGQVVDFTLDGKPQKRYKLPQGVKCITRDGEFIYAGCNDGGLYDLTHGQPRLMSMVESFSSVYWIDVCDGMICASDAAGHIALVNYEGEVIWKKKGKGSDGWMARIDGTAVYHGHGDGVDKYAIADGRKLWSAKANCVLFGVQNESFVYPVASEGILKIDKKTGKTTKNFGESSYPSNESGDNLVFGGGRPIVCFDEKTGKIVYNLDTDDGLSYPMSMQYFKGRLYCVGDDLSVIDLRPEAVKSTIAGKSKGPKLMKVGDDVKVEKPMEEIEAVSEAETGSGGVIVQCFKEGSKLRVHPVSSGYYSNWNCQFPRAIRREGARYWVERLIKAPGKFYRTFGEIKEIRS